MKAQIESRMIFPISLVLILTVMLSGPAPNSGQAQVDPTLLAQARPTPATTSGRRIQVSRGVSLSHPQNWSPPAKQRYRNATELVTPARAALTGVAQARMVINSEPRRNHAEAVRRLGEIAAEYAAPVEYLQIDGWPALERRYTAPFPQRGKPQKPNTPEMESLRVTTAIAAGDLLVRLETILDVKADPKLASDALAIGRTTSFVQRGDPAKSEEDVRMLRRLPRPLSTPAPATEIRGASGRRGRKGAIETGAPVSVQTGVGELEVAVSNDGQNVVIGANSGFSNSTDWGKTFTFRGPTPGTFPRDGDPSLGFGVSGSFYYGFIGFPNGTAAAGGVTGCSTSIGASADNGVTFPFVNHAVLCPQIGAGLCFPDQEHIAADRVNAAPGGGDQVYSVWRNFTPIGAPPANCGSISSGAVSPSIVCSQDSAATWTAPTAITAAGDFPRITTAADGMVYVVFRSGANIMLNKFSSCGAGLAQQVGFPVVVAAFTTVPCPVAGLDRCNNGNVLSSPTVAVDDTNANHIYVAFASNTAAGNENIIVTDSLDGGATWPNSIAANSAVASRRFMPWVCTLNGDAYVTWYDRRAATAGNNDLTDFYVNSVSPQGGLLVAGPELNLTTNADPQCASGWPSRPRNINDSEGCSVQPQLAGRCSVTNAPCDFSDGCPAGAGVCNTGGGSPKYGDYNGSACGAGRLYAAWASATAPPGLPAVAQINVFSSTVRVSDFYIRDWTDSAVSGDDGAEPSTHAVFYATSDVWNQRSTTPLPFVNDQPTNEDAGNGAGNIGDNWAYARIRRNASLLAGPRTVTAHFLVSKLGTGSNYADAGSMDPDVSFPDPDPTLTFNAADLGPTITTPYHWHLNPVASSHLCLAVEISAPGDPFIAPSLAGFAPGFPLTNSKITDDNNKAQRNLGLSTTPATGEGGASYSFYAIAHNAATYRRNMVLRYDADPDIAKRLGDARIEIVGGRSTGFKSGDTITLENMQPGENRWIGLTLKPPPGKEGEILPVYFHELVGKTMVNGFVLGIKPASMGRVIKDNLERHRSVVTRLVTGFKVGRREDVEDTEKLVKYKDVSRKDYLEFLGSHLQSTEESVSFLLRSYDAKDNFGTLEAMHYLGKAIKDDDASAAAVAHITFLNKLDSFMTMLQLASGDTADILQNVRWQNELYTKVPSLARLRCSGSLRNASQEFIRAYGWRKISNKDYPALIRGLRRCFNETANATRTPGLDLTAIDLSLGDLTSLQKAHRDYLLKLQSLAK